MEDMIKHGLSSNGAINAAFVRFLTKQVAVTAATSSGKADGKTDSWKQKLTDDVAKAAVTASEAKASAKNAQQTATKAREDIKNLYAKNNELKR
jgi:hypothetical protein